MPQTNALAPYSPTQWVDGTAPAINATNLNHIENGIKEVSDAVIALEGYDLDAILDRLTSLEGQVNAIQIDVDALKVAPPVHSHIIGDVSDLQTSLDGKPDGSWSRSGTTLNIDIAGS